MKYLIADLVVEFTAKYPYLQRLARPFAYNGSRKTDVFLTYSDEQLENLLERMVEGSTAERAEEFRFSSEFNRAIIRHNAMLIHSSALICDEKAYLFSASSGVGKSFHTRLWLKAFGDRVHIMNDDKPVVRIYDDKVIAYGTPFDGGSGIALNESYPLGAIIFLERGEENSVRIPDTVEILKRLYFSTAHFIGRKTAEAMLSNFERLIGMTRFYILSCNMDISSAQVAYHSIIEQGMTQ